ncbi:hypothetical protein IWQ62_005817, partial [Dispira parvispora]
SPDTCSSCHARSKRLSVLSGIPLCPTCTFLFTTSPRKLRSRGQRNKRDVAHPSTSPSALVATNTPCQSPSTLVIHSTVQTQVCLDNPQPVSTHTPVQVKNNNDVKKESATHLRKMSSEGRLSDSETQLPFRTDSSSVPNLSQSSSFKAHPVKASPASKSVSSLGPQNNAPFSPATTSVRSICESCTKPCPLRQKLQLVGKLRICPSCAPLFIGSQVTTRRSRQSRPSQPSAISRAVPSVKSPRSCVKGKSTCDQSPLSHVSEPSTPRKIGTSGGNDNKTDGTKTVTTRYRVKPVQSHAPDAAYITTGAFLTRNALKQLTEESHGFVEEFHNFRPFQQVRVLQPDRQWYPGKLLAIQDGKVQVQFIDQSTWPSQWLPVDSRRLLSEEAYLETNPTTSVPETNHIAPTLENTVDESRESYTVSKPPSASAELVDQSPVNSPGKSCQNDSDHEVSTQLELPDNDSSCDVTTEPSALSEVSQFGCQLIQNNFHSAIMLMERQGIVLSDHGISGEGAGDGYFDKAATRRFFNLNLQSFVALPPFQDLSDFTVCYEVGAYVRVRDRVNQWSNACVVAIDREKFTVSIRYAGFSTSTQETLPMNSNRIRVTLKDILTVWQTSHQKHSTLSPKKATSKSHPTSPTLPLPTAGESEELHEVNVTSSNHSLVDGDKAAGKDGDCCPPLVACNEAPNMSASSSAAENHYSQRQGRLWSALFNFKQSKSALRPMPRPALQACQETASLLGTVTQPSQATPDQVEESGTLRIGPVPNSSLSALLQQEMALLRHNETFSSTNRALILQKLLQNAGPASRTKGSED